MSYSNDRLWLKAKNKFHGTKYDNNWVYIMSYYNHIGGRVIRMYCVPEQNKPCRVLCKLDNQDLVLTVNEHNQYRYYDTELLLNSPKMFSYADENMEDKITHRVKKGTVYGKHTFSYYTLEGDSSE